MRTLELRVGAAALLVGVVLLAAGLWEMRPSGPRPVTVFVDFPAASGLKVGSKTCISNVQIGAVVGMVSFDGRHVEALGRRVYVRAEIELEAETARLVRDNARYTITTEGVLGERYVEITPSTEDAAPVSPGAIVVGAPSFQQEALARNSNSLNLSVTHLVRKHNAAITKAREEASTALDSTNSALERVTALVDRHGSDVELLGARTAETRRHAEATASALSEAVETARRGDAVGQAERTASMAQAATKAANAEVALTFDQIGNLQRAAAEFRTVVVPPFEHIRTASAAIALDAKALASAARSPDTSLGALRLDRELLDDILSMTKDVKRHPWKLLLNWDQ